MITFSEGRTEASQPKTPDEENPKNSAVSRGWTIGWPAKFRVNTWKVAHIGMSALRIHKQHEGLLYHGENITWSHGSLKCDLGVWYTCSYCHQQWRDCAGPWSFPRNIISMNTSMEQLCHEERVNDTGKQTEISERMILWRRWIKRKYWASIIIRWELRASWRNHCAADLDQKKACY